jgi:hypothetical protein
MYLGIANPNTSVGNVIIVDITFQFVRGRGGGDLRLF